LNEKSWYEYYPLLSITSVEMVQLLIDYANENKIILKLNEKK